MLKPQSVTNEFFIIIDLTPALCLVYASDEKVFVSLEKNRHVHTKEHYNI